MRRAIGWLLSGPRGGGSPTLSCKSDWIEDVLGAVIHARSIANPTTGPQLAAHGARGFASQTTGDLRGELASSIQAQTCSGDASQELSATRATSLSPSSSGAEEGAGPAAGPSPSSPTQLPLAVESNGSSPGWDAGAPVMPANAAAIPEFSAIALDPTGTLLAPLVPGPSAPFSPDLTSSLTAPLPLHAFEAGTAAEPSALLSAVQQVANSYEYVHAATGLPWAASIPLTTLALRLALLPLSWRQARIIRTNYWLYKEALALTDQQEAQRREAEQQQQQQQQLEKERGAEQQRQESEEEGAQHLEGRRVQPGGGNRTHEGQCEEARPSHTATTSSASAPPSQPLSTSLTSAAGSSEALTSSESSASSGSESESSRRLQELHERLLRSHAVLANFHLLRRQCDAPHPAWMVVNPLVQIPVFVAVSGTLGIMCRANWPGFSTEGVLWFPDLTLPAVVMASGEMPLGAAGLVLPLAVYGMTMASLRMGFGASGVRAAADGDLKNTTLGAFLRVLPPLLYTVTTLNLYFKVQMAHGVLLHWVGSAAFTLCLQLALRNPALRSLLKLKPTGAGTSGASTSSTSASWLPPMPSSGRAAAAAAATAPTALSTVAGTQASSTPGAAGHAAESGTGSRMAAAEGGTAEAEAESLPPQLVSRVAETSDPNVLVIMGAQLSARQHYPGALHCFRKAVLLKPGHVRAHYSMGQVYSLTGCWPDAEVSYRAAAELSPPGPEKGQALYCVATALHAQGKLLEAAEAYSEADGQWQGQTVILYGRANALASAGRREEALEALSRAQERDDVTSGRPFRQALARLRLQLGGDRREGDGDRAEAGDAVKQG